jgi:hypothetical protein
MLYRVLTFAATLGAAWYLLGDPTLALNIGVTLTAVKTVPYSRLRARVGPRHVGHGVSVPRC